MPSNILSIIVAATPENGIGKNGTLPWKLPSDMKYFQKITTCFNPANTQAENILVMGRKTWCSIPSKFRPLSERRNCVLSRDLEFSKSTPNVSVFQSLSSLLSSFTSKNIFIIGGASVYTESLSHPDLKYIFLTRVKPFENDRVIDCDTFFPEIPMEVFRLANKDEMKKVLGDLYLFDVTIENGFVSEFLLFIRRN